MTAVIILAAGASARMGTPKQNIVYKGQTLLAQMVQTAKAVTNTVMVVLGANSGLIMPTINQLQPLILNNPQWGQGMATSISLAINHLQVHQPQINTVIFTLCDQPFVTTQLLQQLVNTAASSPKGIIACAYNNTTGVPVLFKREYFDHLLALNGDEGARKLLKQFAHDVAQVPFALGAVDIDTPDDLDKLQAGL